jgi:hypothetical protein
MQSEASYEWFLDKRGPACHRQKVPQSSFDKYRGVLHDDLLEYWEREGWAGYADGLFWLVNPEDYVEVLNMWLKDTPVEGTDDFHVLARTGFGDLFCWGPKTGFGLQIMSCRGALLISQRCYNDIKDEYDLMSTTHTCIGRDNEECNQKDDNGRPLFEQAVAKFGPLGPSEVFGYFPSLIIGEYGLEALQKVDLLTHLTMLRQLIDTPLMPWWEWMSFEDAYK